MAISILLLTILLSFDFEKLRLMKHYLMKNIFRIIAVILNQSSGLRLSKISLKIVVGIWFLMALVIAHGFSGQMRSRLIYNPKYPINSLEELANNENVFPVLMKGLYAYRTLEKSNLTHYQTIFHRSIILRSFNETI